MFSTLQAYIEEDGSAHDLVEALFISPGLADYDALLHLVPDACPLADWAPQEHLSWREVARRTGFRAVEVAASGPAAVLARAVLQSMPAGAPSLG